MKLFLSLFLIFISQCVWAFGDLGHKMVAKAAWQQLTPYAKQNVERILGVGEKAFVEASVWADEIKSNEDFNYLKPLHYVNMPKAAKRYDAKRDCKKDRCVVAAIHEFSDYAKRGSEKEKVLALRMLIHLIADVHQPLHAGLYEDRGGNWYEVKYQGQSLSLHKLWDHQMVERFDANLDSGARKLVLNQAPVSLNTPKAWAEESHAITVDFVYQAKENYPLSDVYLEQADIIMAKQLSRGAWRLAMWLNQLW